MALLNQFLSVPKFDLDDNPQTLGTRWEQWLARFENCLIGMDVTADGRKKALLLHFVGEAVYDIYMALPSATEGGTAAESYDATKLKLSAYFKPKMNKQFAIYQFRATTQRETETLDMYYARLRVAAKDCVFSDVDKEILSQIIQSCFSNVLRRRALRDPDITLQDLLNLARALETSEVQAGAMEHVSTEQGNNSRSATYAVAERMPARPHWLVQNSQRETESRIVENSRPIRGQLAQSRRSEDTLQCFNCGGSFPHLGGKSTCPAMGRTCNKCQKQNHFSKVCRSSEGRGQMGTQLRPTMTYGYNRGQNNRRNTLRKAVRNVQGGEPNEILMTNQPSTNAREEYTFAVHTVTDALRRITCTITINGSEPIQFQVDTGTCVDIIDEVTFHKMLPLQHLQPSDQRLYAYSSQTPLELLGTFQADIAVVNTMNTPKSKSIVNTFVVCRGRSGCLLGVESATKLGIIQVLQSLMSPVESSSPQQNRDMKECLLQKYPAVFENVGKLKNYQLRLHIDPTVKPVRQDHHRRIPYHLRGKVEVELQNLLRAGIIEPVKGEPTPWISPIVVVPKPHSTEEIRICVDMRNANKAIIRERHIMPTIGDIAFDLNESAVFSKIDLRSAYHQLELHPDDRYITTFSTHVGLFRYTRLNFGISSAAEVFQNVVKEAIQGLQGVKNVSDDLIVYGKNRQEHDANLEAVIRRLDETGFTANAEKCIFGSDRIAFYGVIFSAAGLSPDPGKVLALHLLTPPENAKQVRSLLGFSNYVAAFIPRYAQITQPLRALTRSRQNWHWGDEEQRSLDELKSCLSSEAVLSYFDPNRTTELIVDASPIGLGAVLTQRDPSNPDTVYTIAYKSAALTGPQTRYSQIEREALAIAWAVNKFHLYLYGKPFIVVTDHKPLVHLWTNNSQQISPRLERIGLRLMPYDMQIQYKAGRDNPADYFSRHPIYDDVADDLDERIVEYVNLLATHTVPKALTLQEVKDATRTDKTLQAVLACVHSGNWSVNHLSPDVSRSELQIFRRVATELTVSDTADYLMKGRKLVIPGSLRQRVLGIAHEPHMGIVKTKATLREKVWFPNIDAQVESMIKGCMTCIALDSRRYKEPLQPTPLPHGPWLEVSMDFCGPLPTGDYLLVVVDDYSKFPVVEVISSTSSRIVLPLLDKTFALLGIPEVVRTDNGPPFNGDDFKQFVDKLGIRHKRITPYWPQANPYAERFMGTVMKHVRGAILEGKDWREQLNAFLRNYRGTPHSTTGQPPDMMLMKRSIRNKLPTVTPPCHDARDTMARQLDFEAKRKAKERFDASPRVIHSALQEGDIVVVRQQRKNKFSPPFDPVPYTVIRRKGSMVTAKRADKLITRNVSFFKRIPLDTIGTCQSQRRPEEDDFIIEDNISQGRLQEQEAEARLPEEHHDPEVGPGDPVNRPERRYPQRSGKRPDYYGVAVYN